MTKKFQSLMAVLAVVVLLLSACGTPQATTQAPATSAQATSVPATSAPATVVPTGARGGHGFSTRKQGLLVDGWIERFGDWLRMQGFIGNTIQAESR